MPCHPWESRHSNIHKNNRNSKRQAAHTGLTSSRPNEWQQPQDEVQPAPGEVRGHFGHIKLSYPVVPSESLQCKQLLGSREERRLNDEEICMFASLKHTLNHCPRTVQQHWAFLLRGWILSLVNKRGSETLHCYRGTTENSPERQEVGLMHQGGLKLND